MKLFRVYFHVPIFGLRIPAASFRHVWADSHEQAQDRVQTLIETHRSMLDSIGFEFVTIQEVEVKSFEDWLNEQSIQDKS